MAANLQNGTKSQVYKMIVKQITNGIVEAKAPAKINLFLEVLNKRNDGYHDINSLFQTVSLFDTIQFKKTVDNRARLRINKRSDIPTGKQNLIIKAFRLLKDRTGFKGGVEIELSKLIPVSAGLGGGSSDAAATIKACNRLFDLKLSNSEMAQLGLEIGSDIPFFFSSGQAIVTGRGETVEESAFSLDYWLILITPPIAVSTSEAYSSLKSSLTKSTVPYSLHGCQTVGALISALRKTGNDFEPYQLGAFPLLATIRDGLKDAGASLVRMSGSGSSLYGIFQAEPDIRMVQAFCQDNWTVHVVRPVCLDNDI